MNHDKRQMISAAKALPGRDTAVQVPPAHYITGHSLQPPFPVGIEQAAFAMGCFWGAERRFWQLPGVYSTAVGYAGGYTPNPTYEEVCSGMTGHAEVVMVAYDSEFLNYRDLLKIFWEAHDPTQGMRQGGDIGTQYRSAIYWYTKEQGRAAVKSRQQYQRALSKEGLAKISTTVERLSEFYYAEQYHQQYLAKNPSGYCGLGGTGIACNI